MCRGPCLRWWRRRSRWRRRCWRWSSLRILERTRSRLRSPRRTCRRRILRESYTPRPCSKSHWNYWRCHRQSLGSGLRWISPGRRRSRIIKTECTRSSSGLWAVGAPLCDFISEAGGYKLPADIYLKIKPKNSGNGWMRPNFTAISQFSANYRPLYHVVRHIWLINHLKAQIIVWKYRTEIPLNWRIVRDLYLQNLVPKLNFLSDIPEILHKIEMKVNISINPELWLSLWGHFLSYS